MRTLFYNTLIFLSRLLLPLASIASPKVKLFYRGRKGLIKDLKQSVSKSSSPKIWVHCSSVGEFEQSLPVIELLKKSHADWEVVVTFFSPSGYEAVNNSLIDYKYYLPLDSPSNAKGFIEAVHPKLAIFIKYEFWYNFLKELKRREIPTFSVSSIFRPTQVFFKSIGGWNRRMLKAFDHFMVQDKSSLELLKSIGLKNASITGDTRFDRVLKIKEDTTRFPEIESFCANKKVFIVGSLRPEDDEVVFKFVNDHPELTFIIAPHEITERHMSKIELAINGCVRHSRMSEADYSKKVLIIDSIGKLSRLYRLADFVYVGGGFSDGIHNILEPAVYNIPVFFGNEHYLKYKEAVDLASIGGAFPIESAAQLSEKLIKLEDKTVLAEVKANIEKYVNSNRGAAQKVVDLIDEMVE